MKKWNLFIFAVTVVFFTTSCKQQQEEVFEMTAPAELRVLLSDLEITGDTTNFKPDWVERETEDGITEFVLRLKSSKAAVPPNFNIAFSFPSMDIAQYWNPGNSMDKVNYYYSSISSRASANAPILTFLNNRNHNRMTIALSDALNKVNIYSELIEEDSRFHVTVNILNERLPAIEEYEIVLRLDTRNIHFNESVDAVSEWWAQMPEYTPAIVPDDAKHPMYSTWYSFHQSLDVPRIMSELKKANELGMTAIIVDDGWQTMDSQRGYAYTGDWKPDRIPEMKVFVDSVHQLDMKFLLWYSLPFVGENSDNYSRFKGKYLMYWNSQGTHVLDPRYPDVREFIISTYENALNDWGLDGFKLDFLGWFRANENTDLTIGNGRDIASVNVAVDVLMTDIMNRLKVINPEIMIEFRQPYIGPLMRKYGNMFRASDCPNMATVNKVRTTDLRLLAGNTAVHSDMFMWHKDDPVESAALQILNIMFSVPQLSVLLDSLSAEQLNMAQYYLEYWNDNREVLLDGKFQANDPSALYPVLRSEKDGKEIIAVYNDAFVTVTNLGHSLDVINAKESNTIILNVAGSSGKFKVHIFDCMGHEIDSFTKKLSGNCSFSVPASGLIKFSKI